MPERLILEEHSRRGEISTMEKNYHYGKKAPLWGGSCSYEGGGAVLSLRTWRWLNKDVGQRKEIGLMHRFIPGNYRGNILRAKLGGENKLRQEKALSHNANGFADNEKQGGKKLWQ